MKFRKKVFIFILFTLVFITQKSYSQEKNNIVKVNKHFVFDTIPTDLEEQAKSADRILHGVVIGKKFKKDPKSKVNYYQVMIKVKEWIKPKKRQDKNITIKIWDATANSFSFNVGEEVVVAFHPNSKMGFTTPISVGEGLYKIKRLQSNTSDGGLIFEKVAVNRNNNLGLTSNIKSKKKISLKDKDLLKRIEDLSRAGKPISCEDLKAAFRELANK